MSGLDLQRRLHEVGDATPIIFVTAHDDTGIREQARRAHCSAYLLKPVPREAIVGAVSKAVNPKEEPCCKPLPVHDEENPMRTK
jgi:FixJ family two-component response regulator